MTIIALRLFVLSMTSLAAFWVFGVSPLKEVLLCSYGKDKLLIAFVANEDLRLKACFHDVPSMPSKVIRDSLGICH